MIELDTILLRRYLDEAIEYRNDIRRDDILKLLVLAPTEVSSWVSKNKTEFVSFYVDFKKLRYVMPMLDYTVRVEVFFELIKYNSYSVTDTEFTLFIHDIKENLSDLENIKFFLSFISETKLIINAFSVMKSVWEDMPEVMEILNAELSSVLIDNSETSIAGFLGVHVSDVNSAVNQYLIALLADQRGSVLEKAELDYIEVNYAHNYVGRISIFNHHNTSIGVTIVPVVLQNAFTDYIKKRIIGKNTENLGNAYDDIKSLFLQSTTFGIDFDNGNLPYLKGLMEDRTGILYDSAVAASLNISRSFADVSGSLSTLGNDVISYDSTVVTKYIPSDAWNELVAEMTIYVGKYENYRIDIINLTTARDSYSDFPEGHEYTLAAANIVTATANQLVYEDLINVTSGKLEELITGDTYYQPDLE